MRYSLLLVLIFFTQNLVAQRVWSYQDCAQYAVEHNYEIRNNTLDVERQQVLFNAQRLSMLPTVAGTVDYGLNRGRAVDPNTYNIVEREFFSNSYGVRASLPLFNGFKTQNRISFEKYNLRATKELAEAKKNELVFNVLDAYVTHLLHMGLVEIQQEQYEISVKELDRIRKLIEVGKISGTERYEAEARLAGDEALLIKYQNDAKISENTLRRFMNLHPDSILTIKGIEVNELSNQSFPEDSIYSFAATNVPSIKYFRNIHIASKKQVGIWRANLMPSLSLYGGWFTGYYETRVDDEGKMVPFNDQFRNNENMNYGLSLYVPIFQGFSTRSNIQISKIAQEKAANALAAELVNLKYEVNENLLLYEGAVSEYQAALKKDKSESMAFTAAGKRRDKGLISIMDFFESKNNLAKAQAEVLRTKLQIFLRDRTIGFYLTGSIL